MGYEIVNINVSGGDEIVTASATFQVVDDTSKEVVFSQGLSAKRRVTAPAGWYVNAKADLLKQRDAAIKKYESTMGKVLVETKKTSVVDIVADIKTHLEGGL